MSQIAQLNRHIYIDSEMIRRISDMNDISAINYEQEIPDILRSMSSVHNTMETYGFDKTLNHLVLLRASQINSCGYCVEMHTREAREDGETNERLDKVIVWDQVDDFSAREKAALAWTEALTTLSKNNDLGLLRSHLKKHFSDQEIGILTATIAMINLWNRIRVSGH